VALELGGNASVLIAADADLDYAAKRCVAGGFAYAGQVCISVQHILIEESAYEPFVAKLLDNIADLKAGDPVRQETTLGPVISESEASRIAEWLGEARDAGARFLTGGARVGLAFEPTVVATVPTDTKLWQREIFGPVVTVTPFSDWTDAINLVNGSRYGLQAGLFTNNLTKVLSAFDSLDVGGIVVNDVPSYRADNMPYGGIKASGLGREGVKYAIEEMTELKLMVFAGPP
jgi:glyceraldehyde-3-phosphate dehydrogenase (NADP+)